MSNPYAQNNNNNSYELKTYVAEDDFVGYMQDISNINKSLDEYGSLVGLIKEKQRNLLQELDLNEEDGDYNSRQVDALVNEAQRLQLELKDRIKSVQARGVSDPTKHSQAEVVRKRFLQLIQDYRVIEANNTAEAKQRAERQYRIIKPEASEDEVRQVVDDYNNGEQYFQAALMQSNRRGEARTVLNEVQTRHRELLKLEKTMAELNRLVQDMNEMVAEQDNAVQQIEAQMGDVQHDIEHGVKHTDSAVKSARGARKKKIWCFIICFIIVAVLALALGIHFGTK